MQSYATGNAAGAGRRANANSVRPILTKEFSYTGLGTGTTRTSGDYSYRRGTTRTSGGLLVQSHQDCAVYLMGKLMVVKDDGCI